MKSVFLAQAQALPTARFDDVTGAGAGVHKNVIDLNAVPTLFSNILAVAVALIGLVSFGMLLSGGVKFLTSGGDPKHIDEAKNTITFAIVGLVLTILSYLIIKYLGAFFNVDLLQFKWPTT